MNTSLIVASFERFLLGMLLRISRREDTRKATILVYHSVSAEEDKSRLRSDSVRVKDFDLQMKFLRKQSFNVIPLQKLVYFLRTKERIPGKTVVVTFDDGYKSTFLNAYPILRKYDIPASVFVAVGYIGGGKPFPWLNSGCEEGESYELVPMSWEEVAELHSTGIEIGSHTYSHKFMPKLRKEEIEEEILKSQLVIKDKTDEVPFSFALPFSFPIKHRSWPNFESILVSALKKGGYTSCCTMLRDHITSKTPPFCLKRIPIFKYDDLNMFYAKLLGCYSWNYIPQLIFQNYFKNYGKLG